MAKPNILLEALMADKSKLGMEFPPYTLNIEKSKIAEYVTAVSQKDDPDQIREIYRDEEAAQKAGYENIPAPPAFSTCVVFWTGGGLMGTVNALGVDLTRLLHSEEEYEYLAPVVAGDTLTRKMKVIEMYERGRKDRKGWYAEVTVLQTDFFNQRGELVIRNRTTFMERY